MDMQPADRNPQTMDMQNMHDLFWRNDQISILYLSSVPLLNAAGKINSTGFLEAIQNQPNLLTNFLQSDQRTYQEDVPTPPDPSIGEPLNVQVRFLNDDSPVVSSPGVMADAMPREKEEQLPPGIYPFTVNLSFGNLPVPRTPFVVSSSISSYFKIVDLSQPDNPIPTDDALMLKVVKKINAFRANLNEQQHGNINAAVIAPVMLNGATPDGIGQGCPLIPPIPASDSCSNWHYRLPKISSDLKTKTGEGVTVFILDAIPERGIIERAVRDAGDDNVLLRNVYETVSFDYSLLSGVQEAEALRGMEDGFVGKDVYGRHYPILLQDHGLYIAGIVRDVARKANIECVRVLNGFCVGDMNVLSNALTNIYNRKIGAAGPSLEGKPVVINMSLVFPTDAELSQGIDPSSGGFGTIRAAIFLQIKALTDLGVVIAASAGNEGDERETSGPRPIALYPAQFCYAPYNDDNIIPVGAVDSSGSATKYSCYPGPRGVATYGGDVPKVSPKLPPSANPTVDTSDMPHGIYASVEYPPLSVDPPEQYYAASDEHAWAYWVGTSFATPIVTALAARILQSSPTMAGTGVHDAILSEAADTVQWTNLSGSVLQESGNMLLAVQECRRRDYDEDDDEDEDEE